MKQDKILQDRVSELYAEALRFYSEGEVELVEAKLRDILTLDPLHAFARNDLGSILFSKGEIDTALLNINLARTLAPTDKSVEENFRTVLDALGSAESLNPPIEDKDAEPVIVIVDNEKLQRWENTILEVTKTVAQTALEYLPENGVFLDIGGNVGLFSALLLANRKCRGVLFEPVPEYFTYCKTRFERDSRIECVPLALSDSKGSFSLWLDHTNLGWNTMLGDKQTEGMKETKIQTITFDEWYSSQSKITEIDLIKIDVEGAEFRVLEGMRGTLASLKKKPTIVCEVAWGPSGHPNWDREAAVFEWLFANGYERVDYNIPGTRDLIFKPKIAVSGSVSSSKNPRLTLGVPTRNRLEPLLTLIKSVEHQTYKNFDLVISDDGDKFDLTAEIKNRFPNLSFKVVRGPKISLPANRQSIMDRSPTELVVMCDDDHYMEPTCLERLVESISQDEKIGIVSAIWPHPGENPKTVKFEDYKDLSDYKLSLDDIHIGGDFWWKNGCEMFKSFQETPQLFESEFAGGGCLIYRKSAVQICGGFPDDLSVVSFREDTDMSHRMWLRGYRIIVDPSAIAYHLRADEGGCKDSTAWEYNFVSDGLRFLKKLEWWRSEREQLDEIKRVGAPIRVLMFYDEEGWAWWHRAHNIKKYIGSGFEVDIRQQHAPYDHRNYEFILLFDHNLLTDIPGMAGVPPGKIVLANSCPRHVEKAADYLQKYDLAAGCINNLGGFGKVKDKGRWYLCQNGVDLDLFYPAQEPVNTVVACWTGNSGSVGNKGLDLIREACRIAKVDLLTVDAKTKDQNTKAFSQEMVRDGLYHKASVYICASEWEGTPNPALEALASGLPVISTNVGNIPELVVDGYNGWIVERTAESIAAALEKLKRADLSQLRKNARESIEAGWSWKDQCRRYSAMFLDLYRERLYGPAPEIRVTEDEIQQTIQTRMRNSGQAVPYNRFLRNISGRYETISDQIYLTDFNNQEIEKLFKTIETLPPYFFHFGGVGDALLLLSTFYDIRPESVVVSMANSQSTMKAFFDEFSELDKVIFLDHAEPASREILGRIAFMASPRSLGGGATPKINHNDEWVKGLDIFSKYRIKKHPAFIECFRGEKLFSYQVTLCPRGSTFQMTEGKENVIDPEMWPAILRELAHRGIKPIILGTPDEAEIYPALYGSLDKRDYNFGNQMRLIGSSDLVISADSWGKTFAALAGVPTILFPPLLSGQLIEWDDPSANVFIRPWEEIIPVYSLDEFRSKLTALTAEQLDVNALIA